MNNNNSKKILVLILILFTYASTYSQTISSPEITAEEIKEHITFLASDKLKGRDSGTQELFAAAVYISDEFKNYGLEPLFGDNYLQEFPFIKTIELTDKNNLSFTSNGKEVTPKLNEEYITVPFS
ncbi:MAG: hypothetical protein IPM14_13725 [bacterium]|nr:hypothetical protein [bacterium]